MGGGDTPGRGVEKKNSTWHNLHGDISVQRGSFGADGRKKSMSRLRSDEYESEADRDSQRRLSSPVVGSPRTMDISSERKKSWSPITGSARTLAGRNAASSPSWSP